MIEARFVVFYNVASGVDSGRTRFTLAHEFGHYFIDSHREHLLRGGPPHNSAPDFNSDETREREADVFAASLLMPQFLVSPVINKELPGTAVIQAMTTQFGVSLTSAGIRFARLSHFPCAVVFSDGSTVAFAVCSEALGELGYRYIRKGARVPADCPTRRVERGVGHNDGVLAAYYWFEGGDPDREVYEKAIPIGSTRRILTLLSLEEGAWADGWSP